MWLPNKGITLKNELAGHDGGDIKKDIKPSVTFVLISFSFL